MRYLTFSMLDHLILFQKIYDFIRWLYPTINKFPKNQRFVLGQQLEQSAISILKLTIRAEQTRGAERLEYQRHLSVELDVLRILCRLSKDLRFVSIGQYAFTAERINEMGRILGGWQKVNGGGCIKWFLCRRQQGRSAKKVLRLYPRRQLGQRRERGCVHVEFEQCAGEFQHEHRVSLRQRSINLGPIAVCHGRPLCPIWITALFPSPFFSE